MLSKDAETEGTNGDRRMKDSKVRAAVSLPSGFPNYLFSSGGPHTECPALAVLRQLLRITPHLAFIYRVSPSTPGAGPEHDCPTHYP